MQSQRISNHVLCDEGRVEFIHGHTLRERVGRLLIHLSDCPTCNTSSEVEEFMSQQVKLLHLFILQKENR